ncbi:MAG: hypothetical protein ACM3TR_14490 [Caulobacteraceae bacterium]
MPVLPKAYMGNPILVGFILLVMALSFRVIDIFVLRLDERLGEIILSKLLGFMLVVLFILSAGRGIESIGIHSHRLLQSIGIGLFITSAALAAGYCIEYFIQLNRGIYPVIFLGAVDPKANVSGGLLFGIWLIFWKLYKFIYGGRFIQGCNDPFVQKQTFILAS